MPGRILNFSEFFDKYSKESGKEEKNLDTFTQSASNFEDGFDETTYKQDQLGPNRPVAGSSEATPASPGESGAPVFNSKINTEMEAPDEPEIKIESPEEESTQETEPTQTEEIPEPEAGANPEKEEKKEEEVKESRRFNGVKTFAQFVTESEYLHDPEWEEEEEDPHLSGTESCESCGEAYDEFGASCGCNM
jgi:hypothetical protein